MKWINWLTATLSVVLLSCSCDNNNGVDQVEDVEPRLTVSPHQPDMVTALGGEIKFVLTANKAWTVSGMPEWLRVSPESGEGSLYKQDISVSVSKNEGKGREAVLKFSIEGASQEIFITQSRPVAEPIYLEKFDAGISNFTINNVSVPESLSNVWEYSSQYKCMKATAYVNGAYNETESWLISPEIDLTGYTDCYFTFEHAGLYFGEISEEATVWITKDEVEWEQLVIQQDGYPNDWTFVEAGNWDLSSYSGSKVKVGFRYRSTATKAGTWEVRNVAVMSGKIEDTTVPTIDPTKTQWMELPATEDSSYCYYAHRFMMNDKVYRNYSFAWSQKDLVSIWVAYPLSKVYTQKKVERTDAWAYDPYLGKDLSAAPFSYYAGDYARGHQLPSADRLCSKEANKQTFYGTNIVPQLNEHNGGIWGELENYVRDIANASDTTYVVTGCVIKGSDEITTDSDGKNITVPTAFFKALLRYQKGATTEWVGAAFYTDHKDYGTAKNDLKAVSMSIDQLEEKTGLDFFVNLIEKIGDEAASAVEAENPSDLNVWGL